MVLTRRLIRHLLRLLTLLVGVTAAAFLLLDASPLDPVATYVARMQRSVTPAQIAAIEEHFGTGLPVWQRYLNWLGGVVTGDFGTSLITREPVADMLGYAIANSLMLMTIAWCASAVAGYGLGVIAGATRGSWADRVIVGCCYVLTSTPTYVVGLVLLLIFAVWLGWAPVGLSQPPGTLSTQVGVADRVRHVLLPAAAVGLVAVGQLALHTRQALAEVHDSDIARFARARGLGTWRITVVHGLRASLRPALAFQLTSVAVLAGGSVLAETVFGYHGLGKMIVSAALHSDVPLLLGAVLVLSALVFCGNTLGDLAAARLDPRVERSVRRA